MIGTQRAMRIFNIILKRDSCKESYLKNMYVKQNCVQKCIFQGKYAQFIHFHTHFKNLQHSGLTRLKGGKMTFGMC